LFLETHANVEDHFPELNKVLENVEDKSPILLEKSYLIQERLGKQMAADSVKGLSLGINLTTQSIHEDRPDQSFYHRYRSFGSIYARKPIFHWGALEAQSKIAEQNTAISKLTYNEAISDIKSQSRHSYLDLILLRKKTEIKKESLLIQKDSLKREVKQKKLGLSSTLDVSESNASLLQNELLLADLKQSLDNSISQFKAITGWEGNLTFEDQNTSFQNFLSHKMLKEKTPTLIGGISSRTIKKIEKEIEIEKNQFTIANSQLKPKLNLVGGFYQDQVALANSGDSLLRNNFIVGLEANWAIWDSSKSKGQKSATLARKRSLEYALDRELKSFRLYIENLRQNLSSAANRIEISNKLLEVTRSRFETSRIEFEANRISSNRHLESKIALDNAKINQLESVCQYLKTQDLYFKAIQQSNE
jgi:outer membrane protein TolC